MSQRNEEEPARGLARSGQWGKVKVQVCNTTEVK
jgi:hypothetical protein